MCTSILTCFLILQLPVARCHAKSVDAQGEAEDAPTQEHKIMRRVPYKGSKGVRELAPDLAASPSTYSVESEHMLPTDASVLLEKIAGRKEKSVVHSSMAVNGSMTPGDVLQMDEKRVSAEVDQWRQTMLQWQILVVSISLAVCASGFAWMAATKNTEKSSSYDVPEFHDQDSDESKPSYSSSQRTLGFIVLWLLLGFIMVGFGPAYVLKALGHPWYFDAARKVGPNILPRWTSVHAVVGLAWAGILLHQTITAYNGIVKTPHTNLSFSMINRRRMHQIIGWIGAIMVILCSASGIYILIAGSVVSRIPEMQQVILTGVYASANVLLGILYVRYGDIAAHKQCMGWGIVWTAAPGIERAANFISWLAAGSAPCPTKCDNLTKLNVPYYCNILAFCSTQCGTGYRIPEITVFISFGSGLILWMLWGRGHWEIMLGNSMGWVLQLVTGNAMRNFAVQLLAGRLLERCIYCT
jgi:hypothetical protein